jgi:hypothetical protein
MKQKKWQPLKHISIFSAFLSSGAKQKNSINSGR